MKLSKAIKKYAPVAAAAGLGFVTGGATWALGAGLASYGITKQNEENKKLAEQTSNFNSAEALATRNWQEDLSNTAHQREVEDLKAAGLNPVLSAGGSGAVTPAGATATGAQATAENKLGSALMLQNMYLQNQKLKAETDKTNAEGLYNVALAKGQTYENIKNLPMTEFAKKYPKTYLSAQALGNAIEKAGNLSGFIKPKIYDHKR